ncbi:hypothetical protein BOSE21B_10683 [Bosea sp. 21B]|nr:hypothetical protein BOSE21B_10683 [Bosea sp. 21B]VXC42890.1 hypothetical protein BOSE127_190079 [Bosea sp. 127]
MNKPRPQSVKPFLYPLHAHYVCKS